MQETKAELTLDHFGSDPITRVENALAGLREGKGVVVLDDESRRKRSRLNLLFRSSDRKANGSDDP